MTHAQIAGAKTKDATFNIMQTSEGREFKWLSPSDPLINDQVKNIQLNTRKRALQFGYQLIPNSSWLSTTKNIIVVISTL